MAAPLKTPERRAQDLRMIQHPLDWPRWPLLPLKRPSRITDGDGIGVLVAWEGHEHEVFLCSMFEPRGKTIGEAFDGIPSKKYSDDDAILDDGWTVD